MMIVVALLSLMLVILVLTWPLLRQARATATVPGREAENLAAYHAQLQDIQQSMQLGRLDEAQKAALETELQRRLLAEIPLTSASDRLDSPRQIGWAVAIGVVMMVVSLLGYRHWGSYESASVWQQTQSRLQPKLEKALADPEQLLPLFKTETTSDVILSYQQQLLTGADNPQAWDALARILQSMNHPMAAQAARKAYQQAPGEPGYALNLAQLIITSQQGKLNAESEHLLKELLAKYPNDPRVLMLLGGAYLNSGQAQQSLNVFQQLKVQLAAIDFGEQTQEVMAKINDYIAQAEQAVQKSTAVSEAKVSEASSTQEQSTQTNSTEKDSTHASAEIVVQVDLEPAALLAWQQASKTLASKTLWIFAKAVNGPRFPLAAKKLQPTGWPVSVTLTDADGMMPQVKLSQFPQVTVTARLSDSDSATASLPNDWQQSAENITSQAELGRVVKLVLAAKE